MARSKEVSNSATRRPPNAGKGRPKGAKNKATASIKAAFLEAFEKRGGVSALMRWADENETEFYKQCGRLIPTEVNAKLSDPNGDPLKVIFAHE